MFGLIYVWEDLLSKWRMCIKTNFYFDQVVFVFSKYLWTIVRYIIYTKLNLADYIKFKKNKFFH